MAKTQSGRPETEKSVSELQKIIEMNMARKRKKRKMLEQKISELSTI